MSSAVSPVATTATAVQERAEATRAGPILALICVAQFMVFADDTIVNVALPSIRSSLHFGENSLAWVVDSYLLFFGGFLLVGGRSADLLGRKRVFFGGVAAFMLVSIACALVTSSTALVVARGAQGLAGAFVTPAAMATLMVTFPSGPARTRAFAAWGAMMGVAGATGVLLSGVITDLLGWRWVFLINVPVALVALLLIGRVLPRHDPPRRPWRELDVPGAVTATLALLVLTYTVIETHYHGWGSARTVVGLAITLLFTLAFIRHERHTPFPMVPARVVAARSTVLALGMLSVGAAAMFSFFFLTTLYMQSVHSWSPLRAGLSWLPFAATMLTMSGVVMRFLPGRPFAAFLLPGGCLGALGFYLLSRLGPSDPYWPDLVVALVVVAAALATLFVPTTTIATTAVDDRDSGIASGLITSCQQVGGAVGLAALVTVASDRTRSLARSGTDPLSALAGGFQVGFLVALGLMLVIVGLGWMLRRLRAPREGVTLG